MHDTVDARQNAGPSCAKKEKMSQFKRTTKVGRNKDKPREW